MGIWGRSLHTPEEWSFEAERFVLRNAVVEFGQIIYFYSSICLVDTFYFTSSYSFSTSNETFIWVQFQNTFYTTAPRSPCWKQYGFIRDKITHYFKLWFKDMTYDTGWHGYSTDVSTVSVTHVSYMKITSSIRALFSVIDTYFMLFRWVAEAFNFIKFGNTKQIYTWYR